MSSEGTITGRDGEIVVEGQRVGRATKWTANRTLATKAEWGDSDSGGYTNRAPGRRDSTFDFEGKYSEDDSQFDLFEEGDIAESTLWLDNVSLYYHYPRALCLDFNVTVDMDTEDVIGYTSNWGADGIYYRPGAAGAPAKSLPT
jgi:hypothetical protein